MSDKSQIEWTNATWNPVRGCSRVSEGCRNCYAESVAYRFSGPGQPYEGLVQIRNTVTYPEGIRIPQWNGAVRFVEEHLLAPLKWKKPRRIFVNSMSDLFHEGVTDEQLDRIFAVMALCPQHTFQVLTKRPERMRAYWSQDPSDRRGRQLAWIHATPDVDVYYRRLDARWRSGNSPEFDLGIIAQNVWLGTSVENRAIMHRIEALRRTPAAIRFLSLEPLLEDLGRLDLTGIDWVIVGGESGPGARPCNADWIASIVDQCDAAGVAVFVKQMGSQPKGMKLKARKGGDMEEWPANVPRVREFPGQKRPVWDEEVAPV